MSYLSVSTWSLHRLLGPLRWTLWDEEAGILRTHEEQQPEVHSLLELPSEAAARGYNAVEICHFHFPCTDEAYLLELRSSFAAAGISFDTLLLDYGDLTSEDSRRVEADLQLMKHWIDSASVCGAKQIRIVAGEAQPADEEAIARSAKLLAELQAYAAPQGVRVITENFKPLTSTGDSSMKLLAQADEGVGFITDFGNFKGSAKYGEIQMTVPRSVSVHVKPSYDDSGYPDSDELNLCLQAVEKAGFNGAYVLIYDGPGDMWAGLERVKQLVKPYVEAGASHV
ncbi:sugar phosphate isomerase/epimerase family protein [Paenibacillus protaetiae]|uniref:Sugar phosphate isomerase/epimerase n=1 Tax=Paenibacillus protaetiae TaxID=2509456 RepID=A0A4P6EUX5_9BACL|nr:TIM barrel protein [Paenibacillus protaetiae]QAY65943.1 sugar phosphate isomerase/epimerase [Paenibacillus protaetiae]